jgi:hypothetical protein
LKPIKNKTDKIKPKFKFENLAPLSSVVVCSVVLGVVISVVLVVVTGIPGQFKDGSGV